MKYYSGWEVATGGNKHFKECYICGKKTMTHKLTEYKKLVCWTCYQNDKSKEELIVKMTIKCLKCGADAIYVKDEGSEKLGGYAFDCLKCGADMLVPKDNPKIKVIEQ